MTIKEAQELVDAWGDKHAIRHNELANMALLTEEIGKLARVMVRRYDGTAYLKDDAELTAALIRALERKSEESEAPSGRKA